MKPYENDCEGRLRLDRYVLDIDRGCLLLDGDEIPLRPKTFAVLRHLVDNARRLVSKDELFAAVWANVSVIDDTLVQSITELRRALGVDGTRLIVTVPKRGYRLDADVAALTDEFSVAQALLGPPVVPNISRTKILGGVGTVLVVLIAVLGVLLSVGDRNETAGASDLAGRVRGGAEHEARPAIAVLPFRNADDGRRQDHLADGLTQDVINALGRFSGLTVMSWNAVLPYKSAATPGEISRNLGVRYQFEGNVHQAADRIRVSGQLVESNGRVIWSMQFDERRADVFEIQRKIVDRIAGALAIRVSQAEQRRALGKPTDSLEAYDHLLRARPALAQPTRAGLAEARAHLRRAIELDPRYAQAYALLAESHYLAQSMGWAESPVAAIDRAESLAGKALALDESEVRALVVLARAHMFHRRYEEARAEVERAIAINPSDAHALAGRGNILMWLGQTDVAIEALEQAQRIDPEMDTMDRFALGLAYYLNGRYDDSTDQARTNLRRTDGATFNRIVLAAALSQQGRFEEAAIVVAAIRRSDPTFDASTFGSKFLSAADLDRLREGLTKAGVYSAEAAPREAVQGR